jgi:hypothetical protein
MAMEVEGFAPGLLEAARPLNAFVKSLKSQ